ncbi:hypothetical protein HNQ80_004330 [Anaerosolibacter carboniphilus]|uniref:Prohead serine protease domain-containing protein n=1 Tax=Anaerosolibacter carboniphilus TaxID=1417629 RepID=A0A841L1Y7_9FIRM|nr:HK97 family phage prohead protease [Anaerosolibacter carboniphilus]MBB6218190.1 hypothetical protein [Anaerosolibacter carboniphilus]
MNNKPIQKDEIEKRSFGVSEFRAIDEENVIEGYAAVYGQRTNISNYFYEVIERGAFDGADLDDVLFSVNHDLKKIPIARSRRNNGNSTMQLTPDDKGLFIRAKPDLENNMESKSLYSSIKRGDIDGMSFIFRVGEERWTDLDTEMPTRHIIKFKRVLEVSAVSMPYYPGTNINARDQAALDNAAAVLENARSKGLDNHTDEQLEVLRLKTQILMKG